MYRLVGLAVMVGACGSEPNVGRMCGVNSPVCDESLSCSSSIAGGYCTMACATPGSTSQCPDGSICDNVSQLGGATCVRLCDDVGDCGRSDVSCTGVAGTDHKACKPN